MDPLTRLRWWKLCSILLVCGHCVSISAASAVAGEWIAGELPTVYHYPLPNGSAPDPASTTFQKLPTVYIYPLPSGSAPDQGSTGFNLSDAAQDRGGSAGAGDQGPVTAQAGAAAESPDEAVPLWSGSYLAVRLLPSLSNVSDISRTPAAPIGLEDDTIEFVAAASAALGYDWRRHVGIPLKTELEYRYRHHFDIETRSATTSTFYDASTNAGHTLQLSAWIPLTLADGVDLLIGGGVGVTRHRTETNRNNTATLVREQQTNRDDNFSWHVGLGADYRFAENWTFEAMYRYADLGEIEIGPFNPGDSVTYDRVFAHEFVFGIAYYF